jgi:hypothetical protein
LALSGTLDCSDITLGVIAGGIAFEGTVAANGRSAFGTYTTTGGDYGTWESAADPYMLTATSFVDPTTIAPAGASSWVIEVENSGNAAATLVEAEFNISGAGTFGDLNQSSVSPGPGSCQRDSEISTRVHCQLGTILPGATADASLTVVSTGGGGTAIFADGQAYSQAPCDPEVEPLGAFCTDDSAPTVTVSVVAPSSLPPTVASGVVQPGGTLTLGKKATPEAPVAVKIKLPRRVASGTIAAARHSRHGRRVASIEHARLMVARRQVGAARLEGQALGLPKASTVVAPAVAMSISRSAEEADTFCDGSPCSGDVVHITSFPGYNDRKRPAKVTITWDKAVAGRGVNSAIYKRDDARSAPTRTLPGCFKTKLGQTLLPCISKRKLVSKGDVQFTILMLSGDPKFARR